MIDLDNKVTKFLLGIFTVLLIGTIGSGVYYFLKVRETPVKVPNFVSQTRADVNDWMEKNKVDENRVQFDTVFDESVKEGTIMEQSPSAGTKLSKKEKLVLKVSGGSDPNKEFDLPDFKDQKQAEITKWFQDNKFQNVSYVFEKSDTVKQDLFIKTDPSGRKVKRSEKITVTISSGTDKDAEEVIVPDFSTYSKANIQAWGNTNQITITFTETPSTTVAKGKLISQSVKAGTKIKKGSKISITLAGSKEIPYKSFAGQQKSAAEKWCKDNNIKTVFYTLFDGTVKEGLIISQDPYNKAVQEGGTITFYLSAGLVPIDNYTNKTKDEFNNYINGLNTKNNSSAKIKVTIKGVESNQPAGKIVRQLINNNVVKGTVKVAPGSTVIVEVSAPQLNSRTGIRETDFLNHLKSLGLLAGNRTESYHDQYANGVIIENQTGKFPVGTRINYKVSKGKFNPTQAKYQPGAKFSDLQTEVNNANKAGAGYVLNPPTQEGSDTYDSGQIIACTPFEKSMTCRVSNGRYVTVPNVVGQDKDAAAQTLRNAGFNVNVLDGGYDDTKQANIIFAMNPGAGTQVAPGSTVTITFSQGPKPLPTPTPIEQKNLPSGIPLSIYQGQSYDENVAALTTLYNNHGFFNLSFVPVPTGGDNEGDNQNGIESISPEPDGSLVPVDTLITIRVYKPQQ